MKLSNYIKTLSASKQEKIRKRIKKSMNDQEKALMDQIKSMMEQGLGRPTIAKNLGMSEYKAKKLMTQIRDTVKLAPSGSHVDDVFTQVQELVGQGLTEIQIAKQLNITVNSAVYWSNKAKSGSTKYNRVDSVRGLLDKGYETYDIAKKYKSTPVTTAKLVRKAENDFDPLKNWVQRTAKTGIRYSELKKILNLTSLDKAKEVITDNFPGCFIVETKVKDDVFLIPVYSSAKDVEWLGSVGAKKPFDYYVSPEGNYMYVKVDDNLPEDTLEFYHTTDNHLGSRGHISELHNDLLDIIGENPNAFTFIGGDMTTQNHRTSVADPMDQYMRNTEQILGAVKALKRVSHKTLDWVGSNHDDDRANKVAQIRPGQIMANMLQVPYFPGRVIIDIEWRGVRKTILHAHNLGRASTEAAIVEEVKKICSMYAFPIHMVALGHTHNAWKRRLEIIDSSLGRGLINASTWVCNAGSTEGRTGTWVEKEGMRPTPQDVIYYSIREDGKDWATEIPVHNV